MIMPKLDPYNITDKLDDAVLDVIVTRLELRGKHPFFEGMLRDYLDAMDIDNADRVLDMGCGTGVAGRFIAHRKGFSGEVLGIDQSPYLVEAANRLAAEEGLEGRISFQAGDTHGLDLEDEAFDAVVAHTLLSHVGDPLAVLGEAKRVAKPGAMIGIFDGDYASLTFGQEDEAKSKADDEKVISAMVTQPRVMRQIPRLAKRAGLQLVKVFPYVLAEAGQADFWGPAIESLRTLLPKAGAMNETEAQAWADAQLEASEQGVFFGANNFYGYVLRRR
jgi:ubiquinone/menaquinone biosynthesis C-methylase UbiE